VLAEYGIKLPTHIDQYLHDYAPTTTSADANHIGFLTENIVKTKSYGSHFFAQRSATISIAESGK